MLEILKKILIISSSLLFGFGVWYLIFWFILVNPNAFEWSIFSKILYLLLSYSTTEINRDYFTKSNK
jgi:hypothetical protein